MIPFTLVFIISGTLALDASPKDSYIDAYKVVHGINERKPGKNDRDYNLNPTAEGYHPGYPPGPVYPPQNPYPEAAPGYNYGPPNPAYGPPSYSYGAPEPPLPAPVYGGPLYEVPHAMLGILDKLKFKINLFTIGKIILKLVIFKKIVSLIAILCLLLFIPSLKHKGGSNINSSVDSSEDMDTIMMRNLNDDAGADKINNITLFVLEAISNFPKSIKNETTVCNSMYCRSQKMVEDLDSKVTYQELTPLYLNELI